MRIVDALLSVPSILALLVVVTVFDSGLWVIVLAVTVVYAPAVTRVVRGAARTVITQDYVTAARARGEGALSIVFREILPNVTDVVLVEFAMRASWIVLLISTLSFLGFGANPPTPDWGLMVQENRTALTSCRRDPRPGRRARHPRDRPQPQRRRTQQDAGRRPRPEGGDLMTARCSRDPRRRGCGSPRPPATSSCASTTSRSRTPPDAARCPWCAASASRSRAGRALGLVGESGSGKSTVARTLLAHLRSGLADRRGQRHTWPATTCSRSTSGPDGHCAAAPPRSSPRTPGRRSPRRCASAASCARRSRATDCPADTSACSSSSGTCGCPTPRGSCGGTRTSSPAGSSSGSRSRWPSLRGPRLLVLDEPTTALDVVTQSAVLELIRDLAVELDMAIVLVSHDLGVVSTMADEIAVMRDGVIVEHGPTADLFADPRDPYTRELLASIPRVGASGGVAAGSPRTGFRATRHEGTRFIARNAAAGAGEPRGGRCRGRRRASGGCRWRCAVPRGQLTAEEPTFRSRNHEGTGSLSERNGRSEAPAERRRHRARPRRAVRARPARGRRRRLVRDRPPRDARRRGGVGQRQVDARDGDRGADPARSRGRSRSAARTASRATSRVPSPDASTSCGGRCSWSSRTRTRRSTRDAPSAPRSPGR